MVAEPDAWKGFVRLAGAFRSLAALLSLLCMALISCWAIDSRPASPQSTETQPQFGTIAPYLGLAIDEIDFPGLPPEAVPSMQAATGLKIGEPLTRENLRAAMQALFATGRFSDIQAEVERAETAGVRVRFATAANFFVGIVTIQGVSANPSANKLASATRLQLGELYTPQKIAHGLDGIQRMMQEN